MTENDICGHPTEDGDGPPCQNPPSEGDHCWLDAHGGDIEVGRDPKLSIERQEQIASDIEAGASITAACRRASIDKQTFYNWMDAGETQDEGIYSDFFDRIVRARGEGEEHYRRVAFDMAREEGDTATIMAMLKQRYPDEWGDVNRGEQSGGVVVNAGEAEEHEIDPETLEVKD